MKLLTPTRILKQRDMIAQNSASAPGLSYIMGRLQSEWQPEGEPVKVTHPDINLSVGFSYGKLDIELMAEALRKAKWQVNIIAAGESGNTFMCLEISASTAA